RPRPAAPPRPTGQPRPSGLPRVRPTSARRGPAAATAGGARSSRTPFVFLVVGLLGGGLLCLLLINTILDTGSYQITQLQQGNARPRGPPPGGRAAAAPATPSRAPAGRARARRGAQAPRRSRPAPSTARDRRAMRARGSGVRAQNSGLTAQAPGAGARPTAAP